MSKKETGGAAFPVLELRNIHDEIAMYAEPGMTLRDYFAAKAMQGYITGIIVLGLKEPGSWTLKDYATEAYAQADAMLEARKQ